MSRRRVFSSVLAATAVAAGLATAGASAKPLHWNESFSDSKGRVLSFQVTSLTVTQTTWTAHVSYTNLSKQTVQVGNTFALAFFADAKTTNPSNASALVKATSFSPSRPTKLAPGATWSGTIGGSGTLETAATSGYARLVFGPFTGVPGQKQAIYWITDHSAKIAATALKPGLPVA